MAPTIRYYTTARRVLYQRNPLTRAASSKPKSEESRDSLEIPGPKALPFIGTAYNYIPKVGRYSFTDFQKTSDLFYKDYGKISRDEIVPGTAMYRLYDADDVETLLRNEDSYPQRSPLEGYKAYKIERNRTQGLANGNGEEWRRIRSASQNYVLKPKTVASYIPDQDEVSRDFIRRLCSIKDQTTYQVPNLLNELYRWALESIGVVILDKRIGALDDNLAPESKAHQFTRTANQVFDALHKTTIFWPLHKNKNTTAWKNLCTGLDFMWEEVSKYVEEAQKKIEEEGLPDEPSVLVSWLTSTDLDMDDCLTLGTDFLIGGIDTTSHMCSYFLYQLAEHPEIQEKVREEIETNLDLSKPLTKTSLGNLPYLKAALKESKRMNFVASASSRVTKKDLVLSSYKIPAGSIVHAETGSMCRMEKYFPQADKFIPERWLRKGGSGQKQQDIHPFVFLPFGHGARMCPGRMFADQEALILTIRLLQKFSLENDSGYIGMKTRLVNLPSEPLRFQFIDRH